MRVTVCVCVRYRASSNDAMKTNNESLATLPESSTSSVASVGVGHVLLVAVTGGLKVVGEEEGGVMISSGQWSQLNCSLNPSACESGKLHEDSKYFNLWQVCIYY